MPLAQRIAALPGYISTGDNTALVDAAPGHRFQMYLRFWQGSNGDAFAAYKKYRPQGRDERATFTRESSEALKEVCPLGKTAKAVLDGLRQRQHTLITSYGANGLHIPATSTAPFATGLGNEHPIENGFAFLTPYGLPYLAGSGVKGVLRHAAEELALFPEEYALTPTTLPAGDGLSMLDIWWLFGFEGAAGAIWDRGTHLGRAFAAALPTIAIREDLRSFIAALVTDTKVRAYFLDSNEDRRPVFLTRLIEDNTFRQSLSFRGALDCWDVFPEPAGDKLVVEIMTPHHAGYYMKGQTPHDAESPIPGPVLAVPARSAFNFHVACASSRLPEPLCTNWQALLQRFFSHAFDWLGFGAKTAVGYGAMAIQSAPVLPVQGAREGLPRTVASQAETVWEKVQVKFNSRNGALTVIGAGKEEAHALATDAAKLLASLPQAIQQKIRQGQFVRVSATVCGTKLCNVKPVP